MLDLVDLVRIDHFRGFAGCWEVPAGDPTAEFGSWVSVPGQEMFDAARAALGRLPVIAEDLGLITPDVHALRDACGFPGMRILQFAFSSSALVPGFIPHNYVTNTVAYTGTHDNDTTLGWFKNESPEARAQCVEYFTSDGLHSASAADFERTVSWRFIREVLASVARIALFPMQDALSYDSSGRMNFPSDAEDRWWRWRFAWEEVPDTLARQLHRLTDMHGRTRPRFPQRRV
jgi:4-alpha-glucanotransferase